MEKKFNQLNILGGWVVTAIAFIVYFLTMEPTVSFWDCGEFIASAYKLQVGHPPGAPLFAMMGRLFIILGGDDPERAAVMVNLLSVTASAFTIGFLFWTISGVAIKIAKYQQKTIQLNWDSGLMWSILGSSLLGALAYTFTDTFWFSAVEGEVYATSSLFTALVFWAILKWDQDVDHNEPNADRWIVLIAYLMGLSIGVHLLNLLTIPAIGLVYAYKKFPEKRRITLVALVISSAILLFVQYGIIPGTIGVAAYFERVFVNTFGLSFGTGFFTFLALVAAGIAGGIIWARKKGRPIVHLALWSVTFILLGYSTYGMIFIRSMANPPMDENNPEDVYSMIAYLNREQYGDRPLFYGQYYDAKITDIRREKPIRMKLFVVTDKSNGQAVADFAMERDALRFIEAAGNSNLEIRHKYLVVDYKPEYVFEPTRMTLFPRMWSYQDHHVRDYKSWGKVSGKPGMGHNLRFFFSYQINWMYLRYFMWNFVGRESDTQGHGEPTNGHWISGISFIDEFVTGAPQKNMPDRLKDNKGRNTYFFLPLILGILGLLYHTKEDKRGAIVVTMLFILTGIAIVVYLNQTPQQPRERDYAYAGSFYAFCIWIGLGYMAILDFLKKRNIQNQLVYPGVLALTLLAVPVLLAVQNWDDHNRAGRYTAHDFAMNYLNSCEKDAVIFTNGDNDTFPLWYLQEVEGIRTDVRVVNLSLLNTDWYINQMKRAAYEGKPVPFSLEEPQYRAGQREQVLMDTRNTRYYTVQEHMEFLKRNDESNVHVNPGTSDKYYYLQSNKFILPVNKEAIRKQNWLPESVVDTLPDELRWELKKSYILKSEVMVLDLLANFNWERPIYFAVTVGGSNYFGLDPFFSMEGMAYRLMPYRTASHDGQTGEVNTELMYKRLMEEFRWGNMNDPKVYLDETNLRMSYNFRSTFIRVADKLRQEGQRDKALKLLDKLEELLPDHIVPYDFFNVMVGNLYVELGDLDKAETTLKRAQERYQQDFDYFNSFKKKDEYLNGEIQRADYVLNHTQRLLQRIEVLRENPEIVPADTILLP